MRDTTITKLPLRLLLLVNMLYQWWTGFLCRLHIPHALRGIIIGTYARWYNAKMEEAVEPNVYAYPSMSAWFTRTLKPQLRPISDAQLISPVDGVIMQLGEVIDNKISEVKGYDYDVREFLGPVEFKRNPDKRLYLCVISLWPGNYHGFHSPARWKVKEIVNMPGFELTVKPAILKWMPYIMEQNERVVLSGEWKHGYFSMTPVAAMTVGDIVINTDPVDEVAEIFNMEHRKCDPPIEYKNGQKVGEFRFGSTMVMIFEAPEKYEFCLMPGEVVKYGQQLMMDMASEEQ